ncbi:MAG: hypothetical protein K0U98_08220 [Deltaproteobacteria bacterium]|nr:hypothetical protein [Deltaproteobacteria bacterium]
MPEPTFWWPLELSAREKQAVEGMRADLLRQSPQLDVAAVERVSEQLALQMAHSLPAIVERDGLPHLCHVFNGWGDGLFRGRPLTAELEPFVHRNRSGGPILLQCDPEGDYHPWQSLAYAVMAGVEPHKALFEDAIGGVTLSQLAANSRFLRTDKGIELGHLLFAAAQLGGEALEGVFSLDGEEHDLSSLVDLAIEAHHFGGFDVCRKFHLTEGICAVAALVPGFEGFRSQGQGFLSGQLEMLLLLGVILQQARRLLDTGRSLAEESPESRLVRELRDTLIVDEYLENHCYYAGHLIELAGFAEAMGYPIEAEHRGAMALVLNELNALLPEALAELSFLDCFLHLGHYRRAMTLQLEVTRAQRGNRRLERADLRRFEVDFDALAAQPGLERSSVPPALFSSGIYAAAPPSVTIRPRFEAIVEHYAVRARQGLGPRGHLGHFRRIGPAAWPRAVHYELLDYGDRVGAEIHLESDAVRPLGPVLRDLTAAVGEQFRSQTVEWEPGWSRNRGRLRVLFEENSPAEEVAEAMVALVDKTLPTLEGQGGGLWGGSAVGEDALSR